MVAARLCRGESRPMVTAMCGSPTTGRTSRCRPTPARTRSSRSSALPRRWETLGDVVLADVDTISLPEPGTRGIPIEQVSPRARAIVADFGRTMRLRDGARRVAAGILLVLPGVVDSVFLSRTVFVGSVFGRVVVGGVFGGGDVDVG